VIGELDMDLKRMEHLWKCLLYQIDTKLTKPAMVLETLDKTGLFKVTVRKSLDDINELRDEMRESFEILRGKGKEKRQ